MAPLSFVSNSPRNGHPLLMGRKYGFSGVKKSALRMLYMYLPIYVISISEVRTSSRDLFRPAEHLDDAIDDCFGMSARDNGSGPISFFCPHRRRPEQGGQLRVGNGRTRNAGANQCHLSLPPAVCPSPARRSRHRRLLLQLICITR